MQVSTRFLSNDQLMATAPSIFAPAAHASRSSRYEFIPTMKIVEGMRAQGFAPTRVSVSRVRDDDRQGFQKHMIRFRLIDQAALSVGDTLPEVAMVNSHDGTSSYQLSAALHRLVCANGLCVPTTGGNEIRVSHTGKNIVDDVIEGSFRVIKQSVASLEHVKEWSALRLDSGEANALAIAAHHIRFADPTTGDITTPIQPAQLLNQRRSADSGSDLWSTFNRVQENVIRGGLRGLGRDSNNRRRRVTTREVKGIDDDIRLNRALWKLAEALAASKGVTVSAA